MAILRRHLNELCLKVYYQSELWVSLFMIINCVSQIPLLRKLCATPPPLSKQEPCFGGGVVTPRVLSL